MMKRTALGWAIAGQRSGGIAAFTAQVQAQADFANALRWLWRGYEPGDIAR